MTAIKIVESPKRTRYILCDVRGNMALSITGHMNRTLSDAQAEAAEKGLTVSAVGDIYEITNPKYQS